jgi:hypothetical protein
MWPGAERRRVEPTRLSSAMRSLLCSKPVAPLSATTVNVIIAPGILPAVEASPVAPATAASTAVDTPYQQVRHLPHDRLELALGTSLECV